MKDLRFIFFILLTITFCNCKNKTIANIGEEYGRSNSIHENLENAKKSYPVSEFVKWCSDSNNGLMQKKEVSEIEYKLSYLPSQSMAFIELRNEQYDMDKFNQVTSYYSEMLYFNFKMILKDNTGEFLKYRLQSPQQYDERVKYISFDMQNDFYIVQKGDTLRPGLYQYERVYEVAPLATIMMAFDKKKLDLAEEFTFVYNDKLFNKGFVKYLFTRKQLIDIPNIAGL